MWNEEHLKIAWLSGFILHFIFTANAKHCIDIQIQVLVAARLWRFESSFGHQLKTQGFRENREP